MRVLLVTPPMIQLNTPYPATAYLTGFLRQHAAALDLDVSQADASILVYRMESTDPGIAMPELGRATVHAEGVQLVRDWIDRMPKAAPVR